MYEILTPDDIIAVLDTHPEWTLSDDGGGVARTFKFKNFKVALGFINTCGEYAEEINHHPNWSNVYNTVEVYLSTHVKNGLTNLDRDMVVFMDKVFAEM